MKKSDIINSISEQYDIPKTTVLDIVNQTFNIIELSVSCGEDVLITGFGKFHSRKRKPVQRRNPKTGEKISIPEKIHIGFQPARTLKRRIEEP